MTYTYNITFIVSPDKEDDLVEYVRTELLGILFSPESSAKNPELKKIVEAGGEKPGPDHGLSVALSATFESEENAHLWNDQILIPSLGDFNLKFGKQALFFVTLLENIPI